MVDRGWTVGGAPCRHPRADRSSWRTNLRHIRPVGSQPDDAGGEYGGPEGTEPSPLTDAFPTRKGRASGPSSLTARASRTESTPSVITSCPAAGCEREVPFDVAVTRYA